MMLSQQTPQVGDFAAKPLAEIGGPKPVPMESDDAPLRKRRRMEGKVTFHTAASCGCCRSPAFRAAGMRGPEVGTPQGGGGLLEHGLTFMSDRLLAFLGADGALDADARQLVSSGRTVATCLCEGAVPLLLENVVPLVQGLGAQDEEWGDEHEESYAIVKQWATFVMVADVGGRCSGQVPAVFNSFKLSAQAVSRARRYRRSRAWRRLMQSGPAACSVQ